MIKYQATFPDPEKKARFIQKVHDLHNEVIFRDLVLTVPKGHTNREITFNPINPLILSELRRLASDVGGVICRISK